MSFQRFGNNVVWNSHIFYKKATLKGYKPFWGMLMRESATGTNRIELYEIHSDCHYLLQFTLDLNNVLHVQPVDTKLRVRSQQRYEFVVLAMNGKYQLATTTLEERQHWITKLNDMLLGPPESGVVYEFQVQVLPTCYTDKLKLSGCYVMKISNADITLYTANGILPTSFHCSLRNVTGVQCTTITGRGPEYTILVLQTGSNANIGEGGYAFATKSGAKIQSTIEHRRKLLTSPENQHLDKHKSLTGSASLVDIKPAPTTTPIPISQHKPWTEKVLSLPDIKNLHTSASDIQDGISFPPESNGDSSPLSPVDCESIKIPHYIQLGATGDLVSTKNVPKMCLIQPSFELHADNLPSHQPRSPSNHLPPFPAHQQSNSPVLSRRSPVSQEGSPVPSRRSPVSREGSPVLSRRSPVSREGSPDSPRRNPVTPKGSPVLPRRNPVSPKGSPDSPRRNPVSPKGSPDSPRRNPVSPMGSPVLPRRNPKSQTRSSDSPLRNPESPRRRPNIPRRNPDTPKINPTPPQPPPKHPRPAPSPRHVPRNTSSPAILSTQSPLVKSPEMRKYSDNGVRNHSSLLLEELEGKFVALPNDRRTDSIEADFETPDAWVSSSKRLPMLNEELNTQPTTEGAGYLKIISADQSESNDGYMTIFHSTTANASDTTTSQTIEITVAVNPNSISNDPQDHPNLTSEEVMIPRKRSKLRRTNSDEGSFRRKGDTKIHPNPTHTIVAIRRNSLGSDHNFDDIMLPDDPLYDNPDLHTPINNQEDSDVTVNPHAILHEHTKSGKSDALVYQDSISSRPPAPLPWNGTAQLLSDQNQESDDDCEYHYVRGGVRYRPRRIQGTYIDRNRNRLSREKAIDIGDDHNPGVPQLLTKEGSANGSGKPAPPPRPLWLKSN